MMQFSRTLSVRPERSRGALAPSPRSAPRLRSGRTHVGLAALFAVSLGVATPALADSLMPAARWANVQLPDPARERRAKALMEEIRCLVCQGQSIADSNAEMAGDMRSLIRTRIRAGESPEQIRAWLIERYGNWVTFDPPLSAVTWPLWGAPLLLVLFGAFLARGRFKRRAKS